MSDNIAEGIQRVAALHGITLIERDDDFVAMTDKLQGQEFDAPTARAAVQSALTAMGIEATIPETKSKPIDLDEIEPKPGKITSLADHRNKKKVEAVKSSVPAKKAKTVKPAKTVNTVKAKAPVTVVVSPAGKEAEAPTKAPVAKAKPAPAVKAKEVTKPTVKQEPKKAAKKFDGPDNGNGRKRGKRWMIKTKVLENLDASSDTIYKMFPENYTTLASVSSIRVDFLCTLRAAKELDKLKESIAKKISDPRPNPRLASQGLRLLNLSLVANIKVSLKEIAEYQKENLPAGAMNKIGALPASVAAAIESITVIKECGAWKK